jgi:hypothetical protein
MIPVKQIRIGPFVYSVTRLAKDEAIKTYGLHNGEILEVQFREKYASPAQEAQTVIHEVLHAIFETMGVADKDNEERTVSQLAIGWAMFIRDNPRLAKWIISSLK